MKPDTRLIDSKTNFSSFSHILDARILRALADLGFAKPTLVQTKAIPLALENKDILARARTGSGKTAAYCIPLVQKILSAKSVSVFCHRIPAGIVRLRFLTFVYDDQLPSSSETITQVTRAVVLVPTRELSEQVTSHLRSLITYCDKEVSICNVCTGTATHLQR